MFLMEILEIRSVIRVAGPIFKRYYRRVREGINILESKCLFSLLLPLSSSLSLVSLLLFCFSSLKPERVIALSSAVRERECLDEGESPDSPFEAALSVILAAFTSKSPLLLAFDEEAT